MGSEGEMDSKGCAACTFYMFQAFKANFKAKRFKPFQIDSNRLIHSHRTPSIEGMIQQVNL